MKKTTIILSISALFVISLLIGSALPIHSMFMNKEMDMSAKRDSFIELKEDIQGEMLAKGKYKCCLEKPCTYCIEKTPGHGEEAECSCQEDIYNGKHPCGECIGEILEGHGNPLMSEYFARAIAEKTGEYDAIRAIISEKYDISLEEQL